MGSVARRQTSSSRSADLKRESVSTESAVRRTSRTNMQASAGPEEEKEKRKVTRKKKGPTTVRSQRRQRAVRGEPQRVSRIIERLARDYPTAVCALHHANAFQLLVATILSAQCTDERVNLVTRELFVRYGTPAALAAAPLAEIERLVQSTGFFRNKARNIQAMSQKLVNEYGGDVPQTLEQLVVLPGVGRKTANVVLGTAFGIPTGVVVDTHVGRITRRLGLSQSNDPVKVEQDLMRLLPQEEWIDYSHRLIHHGRQVCKARKPLCERCGLADDCPRVGVDS